MMAMMAEWRLTSSLLRSLQTIVYTFLDGSDEDCTDLSLEVVTAWKTKSMPNIHSFNAFAALGVSEGMKV